MSGSVPDRVEVLAQLIGADDLDVLTRRILPPVPDDRRARLLRITVAMYELGYSEGLRKGAELLHHRVVEKL